jgi:hypothetical protein
MLPYRTAGAPSSDLLPHVKSDLSDFATNHDRGRIYPTSVGRRSERLCVPYANTSRPPKMRVCGTASERTNGWGGASTIPSRVHQARDADAAARNGWATQSPRQANMATCLTTRAAKYKAANELLLIDEMINSGSAELTTRKSSG